jgi:hypothetical protein
MDHDIDPDAPDDYTYFDEFRSDELPVADEEHDGEEVELLTLEETTAEQRKLFPVDRAALLAAISRATRMPHESMSDEEFEMAHLVFQAFANLHDEMKTPPPKDLIRKTFMDHGFTIKEGQTDLKEYVYRAVYALWASMAAPAPNQRAVIDVMPENIRDWEPEAIWAYAMWYTQIRKVAT